MKDMAQKKYILLLSDSSTRCSENHSDVQTFAASILHKNQDERSNNVLKKLSKNMQNWKTELDMKFYFLVHIEVFL